MKLFFRTHAHTHIHGASRGSGGFLLACFQKINVSRCVARAHTCMCVLPVPSSHSFSPSCYTLSLVFLSPSSSLLIPLSDEQIELLNELFLWAPNAHPKLSICSFPPSVRLLLPPSLPPSHHPSIHPTPPPTALAPLPSATVFTHTVTGDTQIARFHKYINKNT